jgi:hypothetical protein
VYCSISSSTNTTVLKARRTMASTSRRKDKFSSKEAALEKLQPNCAHSWRAISWKAVLQGGGALRAGVGLQASRPPRRQGTTRAGRCPCRSHARGMGTGRSQAPQPQKGGRQGRPPACPPTRPPVVTVHKAVEAHHRQRWVGRVRVEARAERGHGPLHQQRLAHTRLACKGRRAQARGGTRSSSRRTRLAVQRCTVASSPPSSTPRPPPPSRQELFDQPCRQHSVAHPGRVQPTAPAQQHPTLISRDDPPTYDQHGQVDAVADCAAQQRHQLVVVPLQGSRWGQRSATSDQPGSFLRAGAGHRPEPARLGRPLAWAEGQAGGGGSWPQAPSTVCHSPAVRA